MSYLSIRGLSARLKGTPHRILRDVSLEVAAGEVRGLGRRKRRGQVDDRQGDSGHLAGVG